MPPIVTLIPVFNDWPAVALLLARLDRALADHQLKADVLLVDDASSEPAPTPFPAGRPTAIRRIEVLELRRNLGHQRAIAIGLAYLHEQRPGQAVLIMDGDGEDDPHDVPRLVKKFEEEGRRSVVFAQRMKRSESAVFKAFYALYRGLHWLLTGHAVRVGNFSILLPEAVARLVAVEELWNHYAAAVYKAQLPRTSIPTRRASRLAGAPRMNFVALVIHGLSAISVFGEVVGVRLLVATTLVILLALVGLGAVVAVRLTTNLAIPGWATTAGGLLLVVLMQAVLISLIFIFIILNGRKGANFLPVRDYGYFVLRVRNVTEAP